MKKEKESVKDEVKEPATITYSRGVTLSTDRAYYLTLGDMRRLMHAAHERGYDDDAKVSVMRSGPFSGELTIHISDNK